MRLYPVKRCFRLKRVVVFIVVLAIVSTGIKMRDLFKGKDDFDFPPMTIKKYQLYKYTLENFAVGSFLKNQSPGNTSYCNFRLGDSESFNYTDSDVSYSPELGEKGPYRVLYGVVKGTQFNSSETNTVTYATHVTLKYLFHVVEIAKRWQGPLSVACFLPGTDAILALKVLEKMCFCLKEMENVNIHFIYHKYHPPKHMSLKNYSAWLDMEEVAFTPWQVIESDFVQNSSVSLPNGKTDDNKVTPKSSKISCYIPEKLLQDSYRTKNNLVYPINVARNVARYGSKSKFLLVSDIELLPSENLVPEFLKMIQRLKEKSKSVGDHYFTKKKHVYVLPVFEVEKDEPDIPRTKPQLLELYEKERAVYFHRYVCIHCQRFPGIQRWLQKKVHPRIRAGTIQPLLVVKREFPYHRWEPIYVGTNEEPLYSELLTWEGQQDKMTQMHEMCLLEYRFVILNGAFLVHTPGIKRRKEKKLNPLAKTRDSKLGKNNTASYSLTGHVTTTISNLDSEWKVAHMRRNSYLYQIITQDVMGRYRYNSRKSSKLDRLPEYLRDTVDWFMGKARRKDKEPSSSGGEDPKLYLEEAVLERKLQDIDLKALVALPAGLDYNEWLASHTIAFFEHINLVYGTVSEFCTMSGCPEMNGPGLRTYLWFDEKGKKTRVPAPQYIDYVMTFIQKTVSDEALFPTKYANEFPSSFESLVRKILRLLFHVLAHLYHCHFREVVLLNLHAQLNCVFAHLTLFNHTFQLIEPKETEILQDLVVALKIHSDSEKEEVEGPTLVKSDSGNAKNKSPKNTEPSYIPGYYSTNSNVDNTKLSYNSQDLVISNEPKLVVPDLDSSDRMQKKLENV